MDPKEKQQARHVIVRHVLSACMPISQKKLGDNQSKKLNPAESSSTSKYVATTPPLTPSESIISMDASTEILNSVGST